MKTQLAIISSLYILLVTGIFSSEITNLENIKSLELNTEVNNSINGQIQMNYYQVTVPKDHNMKSDLVVESSLKDRSSLMKAPLVVVSLNEIKNAESSELVCNKLVEEVCFLPAKYLKADQKVFIGVFCKDCEYKLKYSFSEISTISLGNNKNFHLKAGDSKNFDLTVKAEEIKEYISITSFNLKMSKYSMTVQLINLNSIGGEVEHKNIDVVVRNNWIGGQQALIYYKDLNKDSTFTFRITIKANEDGAFSLEATSANTVIQLTNSSVRFETLSKETHLCYQYDINRTNNTSTDVSEVLFHIKSINGGVTAYAQENKLPELDDYT